MQTHFGTVTVMQLVGRDERLVLMERCDPLFLLRPRSAAMIRSLRDSLADISAVCGGKGAEALSSLSPSDSVFTTGWLL